MKKVIALILTLVFLCSCTTTFKALPRETKNGLITSAVVMTLVATAITVMAVRQHDSLFTVGFPE
jgi:Fe2+ transport system protein B